MGSAFPGTAAAQENLSPAASVNEPLKLNVVVTHASGEPVADLPGNAFTVLEDGQPQPVSGFKAVSGKEAATAVFLVLDAVNIRYSQLSYARQQIETYLKAGGGHLQLPTSLILVSDTKTETTGLSTDGNGLSSVLENKVIGLRVLTRSAGFYGAEERLDISLKALQEVIARAGETPGHKIVIWVSPGWPLLSGPGVELSARQEQGIFNDVVRYSTALHRADVTLYSVDPLGAQEGVLRTFYYQNFLKGIRKPSEAVLGDLGLQVLAVQSGGLALNSNNDIGLLIKKATSDTHAEYQLTLPPATAPAAGNSGYHSVEVRLADPGLKARTDQGFYTLP